MKKLILLALIALPLAACKKKGTNGQYRSDYGQYTDTGQIVTPITSTPSIRYLYDARVDTCFYYASEWRVPPGSAQSIAGSVTLQPLPCTDKLKAVAETIGGAEAPPQTKTAP